MATGKIIISIDENLLSSSHLVYECEKLDPKEEQAMAEEGLQCDVREWPEF